MTPNAESPRPGGRKSRSMNQENESRAASASTVIKVSKAKDLMPVRDSRDEYDKAMPGGGKGSTRRMTSRNRQPSLDSTVVSNQQFRK